MKWLLNVHVMSSHDRLGSFNPQPRLLIIKPNTTIRMRDTWDNMGKHTQKKSTDYNYNWFVRECGMLRWMSVNICVLCICWLLFASTHYKHHCRVMREVIPRAVGVGGSPEKRLCRMRMQIFAIGATMLEFGGWGMNIIVI